jgi:hypothetical protein
MGKRRPGRRRAEGPLTIRTRPSVIIGLFVSAALVSGFGLLMTLAAECGGSGGFFAALMGLLILVLGLLTGASGLWYAITRPRLVLEDDVLQLHFGSKVAGQVPYRNIAGVELVDRIDEDDDPSDRSAVRFMLEISLMNRKDKETWWQSRRGRQGPVIEVPDEFGRPLSWARSRILDRVADARESRRLD